jgi:uncharacterized protein
MKSRSVDPRRLDVEAFAKDDVQLEGLWPLASLQRLVDSAHPEAPPQGDVHWRVRGERRVVRGGASQTWLHLHATASLMLVCQRCLGRVDAALKVDRSFLFVAGESAAEQLDADQEDDVLALTRSLDLQDLVEDELLLALPLVPRHEVCPAPLPVPNEALDEGEDQPHPFAALAALKRSSGTSS